MSSLDRLFAGEASPSQGSAPDALSDSSSRNLEELFSRPRTTTAEAPAPDDGAALQALVGGRARAVSAGGGAPPPTRIRKVGSGVDVFNVVTAVLAVVALIAALAVGWVVYSTRSPEKDALRTLSQSEAVLSNDTQAVNAAIGRIEQSRTDGVAYAQQLELPLAQLDGMSDPAALAAAQKARTDYLTAIAAVPIPVKLTPPASPTVDETSLSSIGSAIDDVTTQSAAVTTASGAVGTARDQILALDHTLRSAMATFAATVPASAADIVKRNAGATKSARDAVTKSADAVARGALANPAAVATLPAYSTAVTALRGTKTAGDVSSPTRPRSGSGGSGGTGGSSGTQPTQPADPSPAPVDPAPVDPQPSPPADGGNG